MIIDSCKNKNLITNNIDNSKLDSLKQSSVYETLDTVYINSLLERYRNGEHYIKQASPVDTQVIHWFYNGVFCNGCYELKEYSRTGNWIRTNRFTTESYNIEEPVNDYFVYRKTYNEEGRIESKKTVCYLGFSIGMSYYFDYADYWISKDSIDTDKGYSFSYLDVFEFCRDKGINIKRSSFDNATSIQKITYGDLVKAIVSETKYKPDEKGKLCWFIKSSNFQYTGTDVYYILDGETGRLIHNGVIKYPTQPCKASRQAKNNYHTYEYYADGEFEKFDTVRFYRSLSLLRGKAGLTEYTNPEDSLVRSALYSFESIYEYDIHGRLRRKTIQYGSKDYELLIYMDSFFTYLKQYYPNAGIKWKTTESWLGFNVGSTFQYSNDGILISETNHDSGYNFDHNDLFRFCRGHCIPLKKKKGLHGVEINKFKYEQKYKLGKTSLSYGGQYHAAWAGRPCWIIKVPDYEARQYYIYILDGKTGRVLHRYYERFRTQECAH